MASHAFHRRSATHRAPPVTGVAVVRLSAPSNGTPEYCPTCAAAACASHRALPPRPTTAAQRADAVAACIGRPSSGRLLRGRVTLGVTSAVGGRALVVSVPARGGGGGAARGRRLLLLLLFPVGVVATSPPEPPGRCVGTRGRSAAACRRTRSGCWRWGSLLAPGRPRSCLCRRLFVPDNGRPLRLTTGAGGT